VADRGGARELHVAVTGNDANPGTATAPLRTIQRAADLARPGALVTVHEGIYRERVDPPRGGTADHRIVFQAAPGEVVEIRGSEVISQWERHGPGVWTTRIPESVLLDGNPFTEEIGGDWFWGEERVHHTADVFYNGQSLFEAVDRDGVLNPTRQISAVDPDSSLLTWFAEPNSDGTILWINVGDGDPRDGAAEVAVRPAVFAPSKSGVSYVTVRGFRMCHAATQWAPPTAAQPGLVGPGWSVGWIIEDNVIHHSRCTGISLGQDGRFGDNEWTRLRVKHGTQRQREVVFRALNAGWSRDVCGSHVVRRNTIHDCEQAGIVGHLGAIFSEISDNHIYDIHVKAQFNGAEIAGIKLHAPIDTIISGNRIHHTGRGIWLDWQAQGTRISRNLLYGNSSEDVFVEVSHGPCTIDNNLLLSPVSVRNLSQGTAFLHNLLGGRVELERVLIRYTPYHLPHSTSVAGLMTVQGGDDRWLNNIFVGPLVGELAMARGELIDMGDVASDGTTESDPSPAGLGVYDDYPVPSDDWCTGLFVGEYLAHRYPCTFQGNVYGGGSRPFHRETDATLLPTFGLGIDLAEDEDGVHLVLPPGMTWPAVHCVAVDSARLGEAFVPETPFDGPDGQDVRIDVDYSNADRGSPVIAGPFRDPGIHGSRIQVWGANQ
jgi:hypothetical protein